MKMWKKMKKDVEAISPVVATLLLIVVAVTAVSALWVWENGWQNGITDSIGTNNQPTQLTLAGSTTVTDFMNTMVQWYMANTTNYKVTVDGIGSGAGLLAIEQKKCDIGMISDPLDAVAAGTSTAYPALQVTTVAYDGVAVFIGQAAATYHGFNTTPYMDMAIADGIYGVNGHAKFATWGDLESAITGSNASDSHRTDPLNVYQRADSSGTQDAFSQLGLGIAKVLPLKTGATGVNGNPAMISAVTADKDGIGFATAGMVTTLGTSVAIPFSWGVDVTVAAHQFAATAKNIIHAVNGQISLGAYTLWHPLLLVTNGAPSASAAAFISYVTDPANNINCCKATGFTSVFQTG